MMSVSSLNVELADDRLAPLGTLDNETSVGLIVVAVEALTGGDEEPRPVAPDGASE